MKRYDTRTPKQRSERRSRIRNTDTKPEMVVRCLVHSMGFRYRLHAKELPGRPDLAFRPRKKVIFVHGCFWHQHGCNQYRMPRSRQNFWLPKLEKNKDRDKKTYLQLKTLDWKYLVIWECQLKDIVRLRQRIKKFLK